MTSLKIIKHVIFSGVTGVLSVNTHKFHTKTK